jgi:hypothetical protein
MTYQPAVGERGISGTKGDQKDPGTFAVGGTATIAYPIGNKGKSVHKT